MTTSHTDGTGADDALKSIAVVEESTEKQLDEEKQEEPSDIVDSKKNVADENDDGKKKRVAADAPWKDRMWEGTCLFFVHCFPLVQTATTFSPIATLKLTNSLCHCFAFRP